MEDCRETTFLFLYTFLKTFPISFSVIHPPLFQFLRHNFIVKKHSTQLGENYCFIYFDFFAQNHIFVKIVKNGRKNIQNKIDAY